MPGIPSKPNNIPLASSLPKVSFRKVPPEEALLFHIPPGIVDPHALSFGYNDGSNFDKPDHYIRYLEPIEGDLKKQVEYDMDEQDQEWLEALNQERRKDGLDSISYETFEIILDQLEKEWFDLMKRVPPKARPGAGPDAAGGDDSDADSEDGEDSKCAICDDGECENSNAIVFCDGCNLAVHQDCYGIPYIPEGQWLCRKCTVSPDRAVSCILCPHEGGAFKQTTTGKWAHLLCAMWIPETGVSNPVYMEPIDSVERIPKARWKLQCYLCRYRMGASIQCDNRSCFTAFHVTCARKAGLLFRTERTRVSHHLYDDSDDSDDEGPEVLRACCHRHIPADMRDQLKIDFSRQGALDDDRSETSYRASPFVASRTREHSVESGFGPPLISVSRRSSLNNNDAVAGGNDARKDSKSARAYKKSFKAGPPLVPAYIANRVLEYITKIHLRKKTTAIQLIARYWSLKREARRGAPLLKRLHLEPWTASSQNKEQTDGQKTKKLLFLKSIREDLERVRMLVELVRKREKEKLRQAQEIRNSLVGTVLFPFHADLRAAIAKFEAVDRYGFFAQPVSKVDVPDYYDIVKEPMDWATIKDKIANKVYEGVEEMKQDVLKIASNAMTYNKADTPYHKAATKILKMVPDVFQHLVALEESHLQLHRDKLQQEQQGGETQQEEGGDAETEAQPQPPAAKEVDAETQRQLLTLGLEPPSQWMALLRDFQSMDEEEQNEIRQQAYGSHPMPPIARVKAEDEDHVEATNEQEQSSSDKRHATPILNLIEDFVHHIYVPAPPPAAASDSHDSTKAAAAQKPSAPKVARKRKASDTTPKEPVERRSTRRSMAIEAEATAQDMVPDATPARTRKQSAANAADAEAKSTPMSKSHSQPKAGSVQVTQDVGDHESFLRFNDGWVLPEGSKRNRSGTGARPEMIGQRPRKVSAPESPGPAPKETPGQRPRSRTVPSSKPAPASSTMKGNSEKVGKAKQVKEEESKVEEGEEAVGTAGSSPLTSDDEDAEFEDKEKEKVEDAPASGGVGTRSKRTRGQRETSTISDVPASPSISRRRSLRTQTLSAEPSDSSSPPAKRLRSHSRSPIPTSSGRKVWAKIGTHPHFPAILVSDEREIPGYILRQQPPDLPESVAVKFFGKKIYWGWVLPSSLHPLLTSDAVDQKFLNLAGKKGQTREVRAAYEEAKKAP